MTTLTAFLLLAQTILVPALTPSPASPPTATLGLQGSQGLREPQTSHQHHHAAVTPTPTPEIRVTIVNATSIPSISLGIGTERTGGTNKPIAYPDFPQGEWTANKAIATPEVHYVVRSTHGGLATGQTIRFKPVSSQYLLLTGDLSTRGPAEKLPQVLGDTAPRGGYLPNVQFQVIPYALVTSDPCHYRIINAMPGKTLLLRSPASENKPAQQIAYLAPGNSVLLVHQPPCVSYEAVIDGHGIPLEIEQEGAQGNCLIPFFLRDGKPDFVRVFEDP